MFGAISRFAGRHRGMVVALVLAAGGLALTMEWRGLTSLAACTISWRMCP